MPHGNWLPATSSVDTAADEVVMGGIDVGDDERTLGRVQLDPEPLQRQ